MFASATGAAPDVRSFAGNVMAEGFVTVDSNYQDDEKEGDEGEEGEGENETIELPSSLRHGIYITPPAKLEEGLRRYDLCGWVDRMGIGEEETCFTVTHSLTHSLKTTTNDTHTRRCNDSFLNTEPKPECVMVFVNDALKVRRCSCLVVGILPRV